MGLCYLLIIFLLRKIFVAPPSRRVESLADHPIRRSWSVVRSL